MDVSNVKKTTQQHYMSSTLREVRMRKFSRTQRRNVLSIMASRTGIAPVKLQQPASLFFPGRHGEASSKEGEGIVAIPPRYSSYSSLCKSPAILLVRFSDVDAKHRMDLNAVAIVLRHLHL